MSHKYKVAALALCTALTCALTACAGGGGSTSSRGPNRTQQGYGQSSSQVSSTDSPSSGTSSVVSNTYIDAPYLPDDKTIISIPTARPATDDTKSQTARVLTVGGGEVLGASTMSGWRYSLFEGLFASGANFEMVGRYTDARDFRLPSRYAKHSAVQYLKINTLYNNYASYFVGDFDVAVIMLGADDTKNLSAVDEYEKLLKTLVNAYPEAEFYVVEPLVARDSDAIRKLMMNLAYICQQIGRVTYIPLSAAGLTANDYAADYKLNEWGADKLGRAIASYIAGDVLAVNNTENKSYKLPTRAEAISKLPATAEIYITANSKPSMTLAATVTPSKAAVKNVVWTSSNPSVATVDAYGRVRAKAIGATTVTATTLDGGYSSSCVITVRATTEKKQTSLINCKLNKDNWSGSTGSIASNAFATTSKTYSKAVTITTKKQAAARTFTLSADVSVSMNSYKAVSGNYVSMSYGGFTLKINDCGRSLELLQGKKSLGKYTAVGPSYKPLNYSISYKDGKVSALIDGGAVITADATLGDAKTAVSVKINELKRVTSVKNITLNGTL